MKSKMKRMVLMQSCLKKATRSLWKPKRTWSDEHRKGLRLRQLVLKMKMMKKMKRVSKTTRTALVVPLLLPFSRGRLVVRIQLTRM